MAQVTSPIILDSTGQQIHSDLQQIKSVLTTPSTAADITFNNTGTGMQADDVQDAITELKSNLIEKEYNNIGTRVALSTTMYTATSDGYCRCGCPYGSSNYIAVAIYGANEQENFEIGAVGNNSSGGRDATFVRKGMKMKITANNGGDAYFYPLVQ